MPENKELGLNREIPISERPVENTGIIDLQKEKEVPIPREVKNWMEKVEEDLTLKQNNQGTKSDDDLVLQPVATTVTKITLPSDKKTFTIGFTKPIDEAWRWLSEFILKIIKKNQGRVKFREE